MMFWAICLLEFSPMTSRPLTRITSFCKHPQESVGLSFLVMLDLRIDLTLPHSHWQITYPGRCMSLGMYEHALGVSSEKVFEVEGHTTSTVVVDNLKFGHSILGAGKKTTLRCQR